MKKDDAKQNAASGCSMATAPALLGGGLQVFRAFRV